MKKVEIIILKTKQEYKEEYRKTYLNSDIFLADIPVEFSEKDFDHIFFEPGKEGVGYVFSERRAKRMYFMKAILSGDFNIEIMYETDRGTVALFCVELECVMYLRNRPESGTLQVGTFFDFGRDHAKMYLKQKRKCEPITLSEIKQKYNINPFQERNC